MIMKLLNWIFPFEVNVFHMYKQEERTIKTEQDTQKEFDHLFDQLLEAEKERDDELAYSIFKQIIQLI